jgi:hypothetical protein
MVMRPLPTSPRLLAVLLTSALALAACSSSKPNPTPINYQGLGSGGAGDASVIGRLGGEDSGVIFGTTKDANKAGANGAGGAGIGVNAYLWRGALDTLGFMPLTSIDPFGGVIITDWYTPPATSGERFKATAYILTKDLRSDGVRVSIFRQVQQGNNWVDSPVSASTVSEIEDKVLSKARRLREQAVGNNG